MRIEAAPVPPAVSALRAMFAEMAQQASQALANTTDPPNNPFAVLLAAQQQPLAPSSATGALAPTGSLAASPTGNGPLPTASGLLADSTALSGPSAAPPSPGAGNSLNAGAAIVADAKRYLGVPYRWGGTSPQTGFDCSGLVQRVFSDLGVALPRTAAEQATTGTPVASLAAARPGDLLFFEPGQNGAPPGQPGHVAIYIGNDEMIAAPTTGETVQIQRVPGTPEEIRRESLPGFPPSGVGTSTTLIGPVAVPTIYAGLIEQSAASAGVPAPLLAATLATESGFNPAAVSSAGAQGIAQLMPTTAAAAGVNADNPAQAIPAAAQILAENARQFGSWSLALAAYNAGSTAVQQAGGIPNNGTTPGYVSSVLGLAGMANPQGA